MTLKDLEARIDQLITQCKTALRNSRIDYGGSIPRMDYTEFAALRSAGLAFIESTFGTQHSYYKEYDKRVVDSWTSSGEYGLGVLRSIRDQITGGWIETTKGLATAEVFGDFLEMAEYLVEQKYKDPAAVMTGSVLEEHLRQLCASAAIPTTDSSSGRPRKADALNADLAKAGKYTILDQKNVTAWLDLRNK